MNARPFALLLSLSLCAPALAASDANCDRFVKAFEKAGKAVGKSIDKDTLDFFRKSCGKKPDAEVTKDASCLEGVKSEADLGKCMKG